MLRFVPSFIVVLFFASASFGQAPAGTTFKWDEIMMPKKHTSPTFAVSNTDATKTTLTEAAGLVDFGNGTTYVVTKVTLIILVDGGNGVLNPFLREDGSKNATMPNKWQLGGSDFSNPLKQFDPAVNIRIEFEIKFKEAPTMQNPNPTTIYTATVGSKTILPTKP